MPFTFAHPAIVLPFYKKTRLFSMTTLIIGSMSPDFEYFFRMSVRSDFSHKVMGIFLFDLPITLLIAYLFHFFIRDDLVKNLPFFLYRRFANSLVFNWNQYCYCHWKVVLTSSLIGIFSHIGWDSFTHLSGYFVQQFSFLQDSITILNKEIPIYKLLQHSSSLIGISLIGIFILQLPVVTTNSNNTISIQYWSLVIIITTLFFILYGSINELGKAVVIIIDGLFLGFILTPLIIKIIQRLF